MAAGNPNNHPNSALCTKKDVARNINWPKISLEK